VETVRADVPIHRIEAAIDIVGETTFNEHALGGHGGGAGISLLMVPVGRWYTSPPAISIAYIRDFQSVQIGEFEFIWVERWQWRWYFRWGGTWGGWDGTGYDYFASGATVAIELDWETKKASIFRDDVLLAESFEDYWSPWREYPTVVVLNMINVLDGADVRCTNVHIDTMDGREQTWAWLNVDELEAWDAGDTCGSRSLIQQYPDFGAGYLHWPTDGYCSSGVGYSVGIEKTFAPRRSLATLQAPVGKPVWGYLADAFGTISEATLR